MLNQMKSLSMMMVALGFALGALGMMLAMKSKMAAHPAMPMAA